MFEEMRLKSQQLSDPATIALLESGEYGIVSTITSSGYPYGIPINYVYNEGKIYIHSALEGHKVSCFEQGDKVSFCVVAEAELLQEDVNTRFKSVIAFGRIREVTTDEEKLSVFETMIKKLCPDYVPGGLEYVKANYDQARVYAIDIEHMTGKRGD